jgi:hypothetical protein
MSDSPDIEAAEFEEVEDSDALTDKTDLRKLQERAQTTNMVHEPRLQQVRAGAVELHADRENPSVIPWGFWGGILVLVVAGLLFVSARSVYSMWDLIWALGAIAVGLLLWRFGRRDAMEDASLLEIDLERQQLMWLTEGQGQGGLTLDFDQITEVVFGMTAYPVSDPDDVKVDAFTLLVRDDRDELIPIIEATPHKEEAHEIGKFLAQQIGQNITYVGRGIKD